MGIRTSFPQIRIRPVIRGLLSFIPPVDRWIGYKGAGSTAEAGYCYGVWLKHLTLLCDSGLRSVPHTIAELGPGGSMGIGLSAVLCGARNYFALDQVEYSTTETSLRLLDQLVELFARRAGCPTTGWPDYSHLLDANRFPSRVLTDIC